MQQSISRWGKTRGIQEDQHRASAQKSLDTQAGTSSIKAMDAITQPTLNALHVASTSSALASPFPRGMVWQVMLFKVHVCKC